MSIDPLIGPKLKIERANEHVTDLHAFIIKFMESNPTEIITERDPQGIQDWYVFRWTANPPERISIIIGEVLYNLRSALDHLACALAKLNGATTISDVYFPFAGSEQEFDSERTKRKMNRLSADAIKLIRELKPYRGGNDFLWCLNKLNCIDKHQVIIVAGAVVTQSQGTAKMIAGTTAPLKFSVPRQIKRFEQEVKIFGFPAGRDPGYEGEVSCEIAFRDVDIVDGYEVIVTLRQFIELTNNIVTGFEKAIFLEGGS